MGRHGDGSPGVSMPSPRPLRLRIETPAAPEPLLLRAAIAARLEGRAFPSGAEDAVAREVAEVVRQRLNERGAAC
jgi:hypothetical protein